MKPTPPPTLPDASAAVLAGWRIGLLAPSAPKRAVYADDTLSADHAYRFVCAGTALVWHGDFQNARQLLQALGRRFDQSDARRAAPTNIGTAIAPPVFPAAFHLRRMREAQRARLLGLLLIPFDAHFHCALRRAPDVREACEAAFGSAWCAAPILSLRELQGVISAYEWRKKGVPVAALGASVHPHYGVFAPIRQEYVTLVARANLPNPAPQRALDIGTGTGVLAAVLAQRGIARVTATEWDARALACAQDNIVRLGLATRVEVVAADLFPPPVRGGFDLIVCNPPWLPGKPSSPLEHAIYDPESRMLRGFLTGLAAQLAPQGEAWLLLSDLAEHVGLRTRAALTTWIGAAGLIVAGREQIRPNHPKTRNPADPLHAARAAEITSLWRLRLAQEPL